MRLTALDVRDLRIIRAAALEPNPGVNLIVGANAAGKTSLLESIHLLATGRSFAATRPTRMIRSGAPHLRVVARLQEQRPPQRLHRVGLERSVQGPMSMRLDGRTVERVAEVARLLPVVAVHPDSHELVSGGPAGRRRLLDQGLFHVEPSFHPAWQRYRRVLAQRNASLRARAPAGEIAAWEPELVAAGGVLDKLRRQYVAGLNEAIAHRSGDLIRDQAEIELEYRSGWAADVQFALAVERARARDREQLTTTQGPHRADLVMRWDTHHSRQRVSRGQQKLLVYLLRLAQAEQLSSATGEGCVLLLDDPAAELDAVHRARLIDLALDVGAQLFITALEEKAISSHSIDSISVFHVEQGAVREVVQ